MSQKELEAHIEQIQNNLKQEVTIISLVDSFEKLVNPDEFNITKASDAVNIIKRMLTVDKEMASFLEKQLHTTALYYCMLNKNSQKLASVVLETLEFDLD